MLTLKEDWTILALSNIGSVPINTTYSCVNGTKDLVFQNLT